MPEYFRAGPNPKELRGFYDAQKRIFKDTVESSASSGYIGTPSGDVDSFNKLIKQVETVENQLESYIPSLLKLIDTPERASAGNPADLFIALNILQKSLARVTLKALPLSDVQTLIDYKNSLSTYYETIAGFYTTIEDSRAEFLRLGLDRDVFNKTELDLATIRDKLSVITQSIDAQIAIYNSGVAQPVKLGGSLQYNLDEPLHKSAMYQTRTFVLPKWPKLLFH